MYAHILPRDSSIKFMNSLLDVKYYVLEMHSVEEMCTERGARNMVIRMNGI